ncbi:NAD-dependent epimerase/dehydratase family protein [Bacillus sp. J37]|uniref:NAD-dependent epimerase/dehydratase family protein n=1 Tax=Bacillus sp. J37 TaxID=935837 RepID=UPI00047CAC54|nr:NAD-dependent epimerase/dehydratase family protein [Bacillus sp. J37]
MNQQPKLLITGANGFTGQHAVKHFLNVGFNVTAVSRKSKFTLNDVPNEYCNLTNKADVENLIKKTKPQYLLHLAGQNHVGLSWVDPVTSLEVNTMGTVNLLESLRKESPLSKVVVVGSALQFDPGNITTLPHPYSLSKTLQVIIAQSWAKLFNMHIVIAKPSNLIGPGFSNGVCSILAKKIVDMEENKLDKVLEVNNLHAQRDYLDVRDAVTAYETLLMKGKSGEIYDISSGKSRSIEKIVNCFKTLTTINFELKSQEFHQIEQTIKIMPSNLIDLGWKPAIPLKQSLKDILNFYRDNHKNNPFKTTE